MGARARFIVLEGCEGVGKSTQARLLSSWLDEIGVAHILTREPGGTGVGEAIREIVLGRKDLHIPAEAELLLILAARAAFVEEVVRPALDAGKVVVSDRFSLSTLAYQGYGRGLDLGRIRVGLDLATGGLEPDLYLVLDVPVEEGRRRQRDGGAMPDRIEATGGGFLDRVREGYLDLAAAEARAQLLSGRGTPEEVQARIRSLLAVRFPETFRAGAVSSR